MSLKVIIDGITLSILTMGISDLHEWPIGIVGIEVSNNVNYPRWLKVARLKQ